MNKLTHQCDYCKKTEMKEYYEVNVKKISGIIESVTNLVLCPDCYNMIVDINFDDTYEVSKYIPKHLKLEIED